MNLDPNQNEYIGRLKEVMKDYLISFGSENLYAEFVKGLKLTTGEEDILRKHFFHPLDLDVSQFSEDDKPHLEKLIFKYCQSELDGLLEARRQTKGLY
jgi:hypothetical protein